MVHNSEDLMAPGGDVLVDTLGLLKSEGLVERLGISVYSEAEITRVEKLLSFDLIQVPVNVLDQRLIASGCLRRLAQAGIEIHARSVFLQGLLLMPPDKTPDYFAPIRPALREYREIVENAGLSPVGAAITFLKGIDELDCILVGVTSVGEFQEILTAYHAASVRGPDLSQFAMTDPQFVNPGLWHLKQRPNAIGPESKL
jgi:aryl-alcohol dehydrogenase-like predicted oxidoreductase